MQLRADGRLVYKDSTGGPGDEIVAMCQDPADATRLVQCANEADRIQPAIAELAMAAGLEFAAGWTELEALAEVTRQVRMVRRTMQTRMFDHRPSAQV